MPDPLKNVQLTSVPDPPEPEVSFPQIMFPLLSVVSFPPLLNSVQFAELSASPPELIRRPLAIVEVALPVMSKAAAEIPEANVLVALPVTVSTPVEKLVVVAALPVALTKVKF
jgi:hypothetical protein